MASGGYGDSVKTSNKTKTAATKGNITVNCLAAVEHKANTSTTKIKTNRECAASTLQVN